MRIGFYLKDPKSWTTFCCPLSIWHVKGSSDPTDRTRLQPHAETQLSLNINLLTLLGCQAVVATQHDHVHLAVDQRYNPLYSPTLFFYLLLGFSGSLEGIHFPPRGNGGMLEGKKNSMYPSSTANTGSRVRNS